jgi:hypothetical protein
MIKELSKNMDDAEKTLQRAKEIMSKYNKPEVTQCDLSQNNKKEVRQDE